MRHLAVLTSILGCLIIGASLMAGCASANGSASGVQASEQDLLEQAAREATAIVQQAQATALVLQAQAQATAVVGKANNDSNPTPVPEATWMAYLPTAEVTDEVVIETQEAETQDVTEQDRANTVSVISVGMAGEGGFIMVRFYAPPKVAERWWQGSVSIQEEGDGTTYNEIPVMPKIGPLIGRPKQEGQMGYVFLVNMPPGLQSGDLVTVTLGDYQFEHIPVQ